MKSTPVAPSQKKSGGIICIILEKINAGLNINMACRNHYVRVYQNITQHISQQKGSLEAVQVELAADWTDR